MGYYRDEKDFFTNGIFQVWIKPGSGEVTFGFGDEYTFRPSDLDELLAFLVSQGLLLISTSDVSGEQPSTGETPGG